MNDNKIMNKAADNIRILAASMVEKAKSGHPGGAMGGADFINTLYSEFLVYDPENPAWEGRDRFFLDPGHMAPIGSNLCLPMSPCPSLTSDKHSCPYTEGPPQLFRVVSLSRCLT